jgi:hypothetical protein
MTKKIYEKVNGELFLDKPLHVILKKSKLVYRVYVILIANKELKNSFPPFGLHASPTSSSLT